MIINSFIYLEKSVILYGVGKVHMQRNLYTDDSL